MSIEQRIKRIEKAIKDTLEQRDWLRSHEWGKARERSAELGENLDEAISRSDRTVKTYENILATLRARSLPTGLRAGSARRPRRQSYAPFSMAVLQLRRSGSLAGPIQPRDMASRTGHAGFAKAALGEHFFEAHEAIARKVRVDRISLD